jgi:hypothetical protein
MSIERMQELESERVALCIKNKDDRTEIQADFEAEVAAAWKRKFPKRKFSMKTSQDKVKGNQPEHGEIYEKWKIVASAQYKAFSAAIDVIMAQVKSEAMITDIPVTEEMTLFKTVDSYSYHTQGMGMNRYAEAHAKDHEDKAKSYGLRTELRKIPVSTNRDQFGFLWEYFNFEVWVGTNEIGVEILSHKPDKETLAEWLEKCDDRGVNIRVFAPMLPYDVEEKARKKAVV